MPVVFLLVLSIAPPVAFLAYVLHADRRESEPLHLIVQTVALGVVSTIPAATIEFLMGILPVMRMGGLGGAALRSFVQIAPVEELCKMLVVFMLVWNNRNFNEENDGIVYAVSSAIGFALLENILYVFGNGIATGLVRALSSIPLHTFCGVVMGAYIGRARFAADDKTRKRLIWTGFAWAWFVHGLYDTFALSGTAIALLIVPLVIAIFVVGLAMIRQGRRLSLARWDGNDLPRYEAKYGAERLRRDETGRLYIELEKQTWKAVVGRILLVVSAVFLALVAWGLALGQQDSGTVVAALVFAVLVISVPVTLGVVLEISYRRHSKRQYLAAPAA